MFSSFDKIFFSHPQSATWFHLQSLPIYLNPASVPGPEQDSVCSVLYASRRVKTCFSIESCEEAPRDSINGALLTSPPASQPDHYIYPSANSLRQQMPSKWLFRIFKMEFNNSKMEIQVSYIEFLILCPPVTAETIFANFCPRCTLTRRSLCID